jgi:peroxiredoxin
MHKSRIIISVNPKFMINSQDVPFDITRQCAQVGLMNINIFNRKKSFGQIWQKWKNIFIKRFTS